MANQLEMFTEPLYLFENSTSRGNLYVDPNPSSSHMYIYAAVRGEVVSLEGTLSKPSFPQRSTELMIQIL
ncbi:MAG: hypothetical protein RLZZ81_1016 [Pseudomonadota bacterium]|jgi:hypothetical protein